MPRSCTICAHCDRDEIDRALLADEPFRHIASHTGTSTAALQRHKAEHLPAAMVQAKDAEDAAHADDLLGQLRSLQARTLGLLDKAEQAGRLGTAVMAIKEARGNLELLAKLLGQLDERPQVNLLISPEWVQVRAVLLTALGPYPDARLAVAGQLQVLEGGGSAGG